MSTSTLLFIKAIGGEYVRKSVRRIEDYVDTHKTSTSSLKVEIADTGVKVYDNEVLLLNIPVVVENN